jgi:RNase P subunit RPR2
MTGPFGAVRSAPHKYEDQTSALRVAVQEVSVKHGATLVEGVEDAAALALEWFQYLRKWRLTGVADELILGAHSAVVEAAACLSLGLVRPALFSMRAQIDMSLSWIFFKDHKIEWERVQAEGEGFKLKRDVVAYLEQHMVGFRSRLTLLRNHKRGQCEDAYRLLSAHVHSQSRATVPDTSDLAAIVRSESTCRECATIQREVSEFLNDVFFAFAPEIWPDAPNRIKTDFQERLTSSQQSEFLN